MVKDKAMKSDHTKVIELESSETESQAQRQEFRDLIRESVASKPDQSPSISKIEVFPSSETTQRCFLILFQRLI